MPQFSAGLALQMPPQLFSELVYPPSWPFNKVFWVFNAIWYSALQLDVLTSYDTWAALADIRINGQSIGSIPPRSWAQTGGELSPVSIHFANGMLQVPGSWGRTGNNTLQIVPPAGHYLIVGNWRIHYYQMLQP
jgi:hypothetical protein